MSSTTSTLNPAVNDVVAKEQSPQAAQLTNNSTTASPSKTPSTHSTSSQSDDSHQPKKPLPVDTPGAKHKKKEHKPDEIPNGMNLQAPLEVSKWETMAHLHQSHGASTFTFLRLGFGIDFPASCRSSCLRWIS